MTQELGLLELIFGASALVQAVMLILVLASLSSWFLIVQRVMLMRRADDELLVFEERFWSGIDLAQLYREGNEAVADGQLPTGVESLFRAGFKERIFNGHICRMAEGNYGGFFGWPNLTLTPTGGFMGMPASELPGDMRVIDMYRRDGDKLTENWIFIDLLHFWKMQGVDILDRMTRVPRT